jgi:hypothetical protein
MLPPHSVFEAQAYVNATVVPLLKCGRLRVLPAEHRLSLVSYRAFSLLATSCRTLESRWVFTDFSGGNSFELELLTCFSFNKLDSAS